eukprot:6477006-Amphidinium_carterae.1
MLVEGCSVPSILANRRLGIPMVMERHTYSGRKSNHKLNSFITCPVTHVTPASLHIPEAAMRSSAWDGSFENVDGIGVIMGGMTVEETAHRVLAQFLSPRTSRVGNLEATYTSKAAKDGTSTPGTIRGEGNRNKPRSPPTSMKMPMGPPPVPQRSMPASSGPSKGKTFGGHNRDPLMSYVMSSRVKQHDLLECLT